MTPFPYRGRMGRKTSGRKGNTMRQGNMSDFLQLLEKDADLQSELVELARKHGFEFAPEELTDDELDGVAGGTGFHVQNFDQKANQLFSILGWFLHP